MRRTSVALSRLLGFAISLAAQSPHVAVQESRGQDGQTDLAVTNRNTLALEAFVGLIRCKESSKYYFFDSRTPLGFWHDPIKHGEKSASGEFPIPPLCTAAVVAGIYVDGTFEGDAEAISKLLYWRLSVISEADYWIPKLKSNSGSRESVLALVAELEERRDKIESQNEVDSAHGNKRDKAAVVPDARLSIIRILEMNLQRGLNWPKDLPGGFELPEWLADQVRYLTFLKTSISNAPSEAILTNTFIPH